MCLPFLRTHAFYLLIVAHKPLEVSHGKIWSSSSYVAARAEGALRRSWALPLGLVTTINVFLVLISFTTRGAPVFVENYEGHVKFFWEIIWDSFYFIICDNACNAVSFEHHLLMMTFSFFFDVIRRQTKSQFSTILLLIFFGGNKFLMFLHFRPLSFSCSFFSRELTVCV